MSSALSARFVLLYLDKYAWIDWWRMDDIFAFLFLFLLCVALELFRFRLLSTQNILWFAFSFKSKAYIWRCLSFLFLFAVLQNAVPFAFLGELLWCGGKVLLFSSREILRCFFQWWSSRWDGWWMDISTMGKTLFGVSFLPLFHGWLFGFQTSYLSFSSLLFSLDTQGESGRRTKKIFVFWGCTLGVSFESGGLWQ